MCLLCPLLSVLLTFQGISKESSSLFSKILEHSRDITSISAKFKQEKYVSFLNTPVTTSGTLFFEKSQQGTLFWEYASPSLSGIFLDKGKTYIWTQTKGSFREPSENEEKITRLLIHEIMMWLNLDVKQAEKDFTLKEINSHTIELLPRRKYTFSRIILTFTEDFKSIKNLALYEDAKNYILLTFSDTQYNLAKQEALPKWLIQK